MEATAVKEEVEKGDKGVFTVEPIGFAGSGCSDLDVDELVDVDMDVGMEELVLVDETSGAEGAVVSAVAAGGCSSLLLLLLLSVTSSSSSASSAVVERKVAVLQGICGFVGSTA